MPNQMLIQYIWQKIEKKIAHKGSASEHMVDVEQIDGIRITAHNNHTTPASYKYNMQY